MLFYVFNVWLYIKPAEVLVKEKTCATVLDQVLIVLCGVGAVYDVLKYRILEVVTTVVSIKKNMLWSLLLF